MAASDDWEHHGYVVKELMPGLTDEECKAALADDLRLWLKVFALIAKRDEEGHVNQRSPEADQD